jgi:hypothetical protein
MYLQPFRGLNYNENSCYIDSILVALFSIPNKIIDKNIIHKKILPISNSPTKWISFTSDDFKNRKLIQNELRRITKYLRFIGEHKSENEDCTLLRKYLEKCKASQEFHKNEMQDAGEFLFCIFNIFQVDIMVKRRITYVTNSITNPPKNIIKTFEENQNCSPIFNIPFYKIINKKSYHLIDLLDETEDCVFSKEEFYRHEETGIRYKRRIEITNILYTPYIIFNIQRISNEERFICNQIEFPENLIIQESFLSLHSIIIYKNHHYTCYIKSSQDSWYYYDDMNNNIKYIGSFPTVLKTNPNPEKHATLLFYTI